MKKVNSLLTLVILISIQSYGQCGYSETEFKDYLQYNKQNLDIIEGIWSYSALFKLYRNNELFISDQTDEFIQYFVKKDKSLFIGCKTISPSAFKFTFSPTATDGLYLCKVDLIEYNTSTQTTALMQPLGIIKFSYKFPDQAVQKVFSEVLEKELDSKSGQSKSLNLSLILDVTMIKVYPTSIDDRNNLKSSGTGFAISQNGIIVTNNHVVENSNKIIVRGINEDFNTPYIGKVIVADKNNDLALIQIVDSSFKKIREIPFGLAQSYSNVGESVYVLGYPLRSALGEEIKLTNGIISSRTGFQGDVTSYQISAPVQPGNSGGPLFNMNGDLIGIINAKFQEAENVSYAVKSSYLINLIDLSPVPIDIPRTNILKGKSLSDQVNIVKDLVYIIEIN